MLDTLNKTDLLLAALSALLSLAPEQHRARAAEILDAIADVTKSAVSVSNQAGDFADKLAALRADIDAMNERGVTVADMDKALARLRTASAVFRAASETAAAQSV